MRVATAVHAPAPAPPMHTKPPATLRIGPANDPLEAEADRAADAMMRGESAVVRAASGGAVRRKCAACQEEGEVQTVQLKRRPTANSRAIASAPMNLGPGRPLSAKQRAYFEPRFGQDFSAVRIVRGPRAELAANALGARAFTIGSTIAFGGDEYRPESESGRRLLAHELAHVVQRQNDTIRRDINSDVTGMSISRPYAAGVGDADLMFVIAHLEDLVRQRRSSDPLDVVIDNNLEILRAEWTARRPIPVHPKTAPIATTAGKGAHAPEDAKPYFVGDRDEHIPFQGYRGPLRPIGEYTKPYAMEYARRGCFEAAELAEKYMCPTCHVMTKVDPCDFNLRGYVDDYHRNYRMAQTMVLTAAGGAIAPRALAVIGAFEGGVATGEAMTGKSSGLRPSNLLFGEFDPGRRLSTRERVFAGVEAALFWTGMGFEARAAQQSVTSTLRESAGARGAMGRTPRITPEVSEAERMGFLEPGSHQGVSATAKTPQSLTTGVRADVGETAAYKARLNRGEFGLESPQGANIPGPDYITASRAETGEMWINVNDAKSRVSATSSFGNTKSQLPQSWRDAVDDAVSPGRLQFNDAQVEAEIRDAWQQGRVRIRRDTVDFSPTGQGTVRLDQ